MNKNKLLSLAIIALLLIIIVVQKNIDIFSSGLPTFEKWNESIDEIVIKKSDSEIKLYKKNNKWVINDKAFIADKSTVEILEEKMKNLELVDLISKKKFYKRFDLSKDKAIAVTVKKANKKLREILIGKETSTGQQVYIKLSDKPEVYLARGGLRNEFDKTVDSLRDKNIISLNSDAVETLAVNYKGKKYTLKKESVIKKEVASDKKDKKENKKETTWKVENNKAVKLNQQNVKSLLSAFAVINADAFVENEKVSKRSLYSVAIKVLEKNITFDVIKKTKDDNYICRSSENPYIFTISKYKAESLMKTLKDLK